MENEELKEQLAEWKVKVQERIEFLTERAKDAGDDVKEEIEEKIAYLRGIDFGHELGKLGEKTSEAFESLKERFKDWFN